MSSRPPTLHRSVVLPLALLLALPWVVPPEPALAQERDDRGFELDEREAGELPPDGPWRYVFAGVGIRDYENPRWRSPRLNNPVNDLDSVRAVLVSRYGFESPEELILRNEEADLDSIRTLVTVRLEEATDSMTQLVFFFAGHGHTEVRRDQRKGYVVPYRGTETRDSWYEVDDLLEALALVPARHVLVILDSCYGGVALTEQASAQDWPPHPEGMPLPLYYRRGESRWVIVSAGPKEKASDGPATPPGSNSLFTTQLLRGLRDFREGLLDDGYVHVEELGDHLTEKVAAMSEQMPDARTFYQNRWGQLVLEPAPDARLEAMARLGAAFEAGDVEAARAAAGSFASTDSPEAIYARALAAVMRAGQVDPTDAAEADAAFQELLDAYGKFQALGSADVRRALPQDMIALLNDHAARLFFQRELAARTQKIPVSRKAETGGEGEGRE